MEGQATRDFAESRKLSLLANDLVTVIDHGLELSEWKGQNQRTLSVGWFPASLIAPTLPATAAAAASNAEPNSSSSSAYISSPLKGSLHHTGHGDIKPDRSWGNPEGLNDSANWKSGPAREKESSNLQRMAGMSRSLESVLGGARPRAHTFATVRVDNQGKLMPPALARSVVVQQDPRRFSEASIIPPPRPPPPNLKRLKPQVLARDRRFTVQQVPAPGSSWPPQVVLPAPSQPQPPPQLPQQGTNLAKMAHMARSTPQLDDCTDSRERDRERERAREREWDKTPQVQHTRDALIAQVMEAVHGVTIEEVHSALRRNDWNPMRAEQQLKLEQLYSLSLCSREDCLKILSRYQWNLQLASRYLIRMFKEERPAPGERPQISSERRV